MKNLVNMGENPLKMLSFRINHIFDLIDLDKESREITPLLNVSTNIGLHPLGKQCSDTLLYKRLGGDKCSYFYLVLRVAWCSD